MAGLSKAHLGGAKLVGASLGLANLKEAILEGANLQYTDFKGANNLTSDQLCKAKSIHQAEGLDSELVIQVKEKCPHLLSNSR